MNQSNQGLVKGRRLIIKIGSALLVEKTRGVLRRRWLESLADDLARCQARGQQVAVVSSGAIAVGRRYLGFPEGDIRLEEKQAAAAAGMGRLTHAYQEHLGRHGMTVAQVLLTLEDSDDRRRYLNARNTLETLLRLGAVPLINENDTVATDEIRMGDNDRLAARVAAMISADTLVLLSDVAGLYTADPRRDPDARPIPEVRELTPRIEAMAEGSMSGDGSGGMVTKLAAARICLAAGCRMVLADGQNDHPLRRIETTGRGTWFIPKATPMTARKRWIAGSLRPAGSLTVDPGAIRALGAGKSLLPVGVVAVAGRFGRGDAVRVLAPGGNEVGRGLSAYSAEDAARIKGHKSRDIEALLGYRGREEMIHRDDLAMGAPVAESG